MRVDDFDYELPPERIAQRPVEPRDAARLLACAPPDGEARHLRVRDLPELLAPGDLLVLNDTRVLPARLLGRRASGGAVELLLLEPDGAPARWTALARPAKKLRAGEEVALEGATAALLERLPGEDGRPGAEWRVELRVGGAPAEDVEALLERAGTMPLPPYVRRERDDPRAAEDRARYQTVYARAPGAVAAPTAGLHFTEELFARLDERGVARAFVTLHVGAGTFLPVTAEDTDGHRMHSERFELSEETVAAVRATRERGGRVVAVGTTSVRVLESCADEDGSLRSGAGATRLFVTPGHRFRAVDGLLTNFHLPRSTLLMLVSAFAGRERVLRLYEDARDAGYRFYSYGDAMLLLGRARQA